MSEVLIFIAKALAVFIFFAGIIILIFGLSAKSKQKPELELEPLHEKLKELKLDLQQAIESKADFKKIKKAHKKEEKVLNQKHESPKRAFVLNFDGDIKASQTKELAKEITAILQIAQPQDEVILKLESPGGVVIGYGLASSQLHRLRSAKIPLTVCVDKVAASGGYMMATVADKILAAPFAVVGSIGVVAQVPNFFKVLKKNDVDYKEYTAGDFKRTVSLLGEITPQGESHFQGKLESTHKLFQDHIRQYRPQLDFSAVANGDHWYGIEALQLRLIDQIISSDDYILQKFNDGFEIFEMKYQGKKGIIEKVSERLARAMIKTLDIGASEARKQSFF